MLPDQNSQLLNMVIRVFVEDMKGGRHVSPCVFSSEEKAHQWCQRFGTNVIKTFQFFRVDAFYTEADRPKQDEPVNTP